MKIQCNFVVRLCCDGCRLWQVCLFGSKRSFLQEMSIFQPCVIALRLQKRKRPKPKEKRSTSAFSIRRRVMLNNLQDTSIYPYVKLFLKHLRIGRNQKRLKLTHSRAGANQTCYKLHGKKPLHIFTEFLTNTMLFRIENCEGISIISA